LDKHIVQELERLAGELRAGRMSREAFEQAKSALIYGNAQPQQPVAIPPQPEPATSQPQLIAQPEQPQQPQPQPQPVYVPPHHPQAPQHQYYAPPPPIRRVNYAPLIVVAILFIGLGGWFVASQMGGASKSGVRFAGAELSETEAEEAVKEMESMFANATPGDLASIDLSFEPKTELAKQYKAILVEGLENDKELDRQLAGRSLDQLIDLDLLSTSKGRRKAREDFVICREALKSYRRKSSTLAEKVKKWVRDLIGREPPLAKVVTEDMQRLSMLDEKVYRDMDALLTFCEDKAIKKGRSGKVELEDADYNKIMKLTTSAVDSLATMVDEDEKATQRRATMAANSYPFKKSP
jgi:hypothetical protein